MRRKSNLKTVCGKDMDNTERESRRKAVPLLHLGFPFQLRESGLISFRSSPPPGLQITLEIYSIFRASLRLVTYPQTPETVSCWGKEIALLVRIKLHSTL